MSSLIDALTFPDQKGDLLQPDMEKLQVMDRTFLGGTGRLNLLPAAAYQSAAPDALRAWCALNGRYGIPTMELIGWLKIKIAGRKALEIGAGNGDLGHHLGVPMTDSYQQVTDPGTVAYFLLNGIRPTIPPPDVIKEDAETAVRRHKPQVVIASWVTEKFIVGKSTNGNIMGPREEYILDRCQTYIFIGNETVHGNKRILSRPHTTFRPPWLVSRSKHPDKNVIYVWDH